MKQITVKYITEEQKEDILKMYAQIEKPRQTLEQVMDAQNCRTLMYLRMGLNTFKWENYEDLKKYYAVITSVKADIVVETITFEDDVIPVVVAALKSVIENKSLQLNYGEYLEIVDSFETAMEA